MFRVESMEAYYQARAPEHDEVYDIAVWQDDLAHIRRVVEEFPNRKPLLDLACGTGYWLVPASKNASSIHGVDQHESVLALARRNHYACPAVFQQADVYRYRPDDRLPSAMLGFWLSHLDQCRASEFQETLLASLEPRASILAFDETVRPDRSLPTLGIDASGNRWEGRKLKDGRDFEIIKNGVTPAWLSRHLPAIEVRTYREIDRVWIAELAIPN